MLFPGELKIKASAFKPSYLTTNYLNGIPFANFFTLHTNQSFDCVVSVAGSVEIKESLLVKNHVNRLNLDFERENTVMVRT